MEHKKFEDAEHIIGWRDMAPGYWYYIGKESRGTNKWGKPITVVSVKLQQGGATIRFYAPPSLFYGLESKPNTTVILYEGLVEGVNGFFPKYKYAV